MVQSLWFKNALIYCLNVESFMDGDGDGIGDFAGLMRRLDYLHGMGVSAVWLMPFQPSPRKDHGYDVADYYNVDPRFGTLGDFAEFTHGCEQRGMRVMMDMVLNHTSDQHPWFQSARKDPNSRYRDWYIWSEEEPENIHEGMVFPGDQESTWTWDEEAQAWYFHRFYEFQPDLNMQNPEVRAEMLKIMNFWIQLGVSGFRLDAVPFVIKMHEHRPEESEVEYRMLRTIREFTQWRRGDCVLLAEANVPAEESIQYFGDDADRLHMMFNFPVNASLFYALATADTKPLLKALEATKPRPRDAQWVQFLRNHDELDLSILTEEQREKTFEIFAPDEDMRIYGRGIRRRLAPMMKGDRRLIELANSLLMTLPGTPVIRYGDEIGMGDDLSLPGRSAVRTPMQWDDTPNAGFTPADDPYHPVIADGPFGYDEINVWDQRREPESLLNWHERIIRLRREAPEIGYGDYEILETPPDILAMRYEWRGSALVVVHNFAGAPREVRLDPGCTGEGPARLVNLLSHDHSMPDEDGGHRMIMEPYGYRWFRIGEANSPLDRDEG